MQKSFGISILKKLRSVLTWLASSYLRTFVLIFILAFGIRVYSLTKTLPEYLIPSPDRELGAIARSLAKTGQFANPYILDTGSTAHLPPIPPSILALIYVLFGNANTAGYVFMGFTVITNSITYAIAPWMADKFGAGKQAGFIGGIIGAFMVESERSVHGEGLTGIILALMLAAFLKRWSAEQNSLIGSLFLGLGIGVSFHVQPVLLVTALGCLAFELWQRRGKRNLALTSLLTLGIVLACIPWAWRNYNVFHKFFFIRDNLGLELRMGNSPGAAATFEAMDRQGHYYKHPRVGLLEARKVKELGEMEYMREALNESLTWIRDNPLEFLKLTFMRFVHFWFGTLLPSPTSALMVALTILAVLGIRRVFPSLTLPQRIILLMPLLAYPLIYYLVPYAPRYRTPIDWLLLMLAGIEIWYWSQKTWTAALGSLS